MTSEKTNLGVDSALDELIRLLEEEVESGKCSSRAGNRVRSSTTKRGRGSSKSYDSGHASSDNGNGERLETTLIESEIDDGGYDDREDRRALLRYVEEHVMGRDTWSPGPFGDRQVVYCDYTASGRSLSFIEDYITEHVIPLYANTHTTTGLMARQTGKFRKEARDIIKKCVNATDDDALIFTGSGTTGAINKLVSALMLKGGRAKKTIVFIGPYEHHSNILPWKESGAKIVRIQDDENGMVNLQFLEEALIQNKKKYHVMIGCFSAASNVTGIICNTEPVATLLHKHGALSFWDYATAAPYLKIDMNPKSTRFEGDCSKDAVYLSPHKFVGGVGTPGVLIAKKKLFLNQVPHSVGGGTVLYVTRETHHYIQDIEEREEGGTPAIVESIRAGLTFKVKHAIGTDLIEEREHELTSCAFNKWKRNENFIFLGSTKAERLPIFSFLIIHPNTGKMLHHNFIAVLLNDLYGIQARGGCACAGPYAQDLLGIDEDLAEKFVYFLKDEKEISEIKNKKSRKLLEKLKKSSCPLEIMKPGFIRLNLPFFFSDEVVDYVLEAVDAIGRHGWKMLSQYTCDPGTANWTYVGTEGVGSPGRRQTDSLYNTTFRHGLFSAPPCPFTYTSSDEAPIQTEVFQNALAEAERIFEKVGTKKEFSAAAMHDTVGEGVGDPNIIWFLRPHEAAYHIQFPVAERVRQGGLRSAAITAFPEGDTIDGATTLKRKSSHQSRQTSAADPRRLMTKAPFVPRKYASTLRKRLSRSARSSRVHEMREYASNDKAPEQEYEHQHRHRQHRCVIL